MSIFPAMPTSRLGMTLGAAAPYSNYGDLSLSEKQEKLIELKAESSELDKEASRHQLAFLNVASKRLGLFRSISELEGDIRKEEAVANQKKFVALAKKTPKGSKRLLVLDNLTTAWLDANDENALALIRQGLLIHNLFSVVHTDNIEQGSFVSKLEPWEKTLPRLAKWLRTNPNEPDTGPALTPEENMRWLTGTM